MRNILLALIVFFCGAVSAEVVVLDLSNPAEAIEYNEKGVWSDVYKADAAIHSQEFTFSHISSSPSYYNGFVASKSNTILESANFDDQWGCMARGGYAGEGTPYLVAYWDSELLSEENSCQVTISSPYYAAGFYVCNSPYTYYAIQKGNILAKKFEQGDWLKLIIHGVDDSGTETGTVEFFLADYRAEKSESWTLNKSWEWVDLSPLGKVASVYFTLDSSDKSEYGIKTPSYFCLDRFTVLTAPSSVEKTAFPAVKAYYDRAGGLVRVESPEPVEAAVYSITGLLMMKQQVNGSAALDIRDFPSGIYVIHCGQSSVKIVK